MNRPGGGRSSQPHYSEAELETRSRMAGLLENTPIPSSDLPDNLALYMRRAAVADVLVMNELYKRIVGVPGVLMEFGALFGRRLALFIALRELYEPYNYTRRVIGFDTFSGFPDVSVEDGDAPEIRPASMSVPRGYEGHLIDVLETQEMDGVQSHIQKFEVRMGDVRETLPEYLSSNPETIISLAYFDLDLYEPTKACLELIRPRLVRGSVIAFDETVHRSFPGETLALLDTLDLPKAKLRKPSFSRYPTFLTV